MLLFIANHRSFLDDGYVAGFSVPEGTFKNKVECGSLGVSSRRRMHAGSIGSGETLTLILKDSVEDFRVGSKHARSCQVHMSFFAFLVSIYLCHLSQVRTLLFS